MKKLLLGLVILTQIGYCVTLDELINPKPFSGRLGTSDKVETQDNIELAPVNKAKEVAVKSVKSKTASHVKAELKPPIKEVKKETKKEELKKEIKEETKEEYKETVKEQQVTEEPETKISDEVMETQEPEQVEYTATTASAGYADLSLKKLAQDVSYELDIDETKTMADLAILWAAATERSETMKYTIYKLSNPDEDKPNDTMVKKILKPIANFSSIAGASVAGDPFVATGALIGGGLVNAFMKDDKEYNYKFSKVSDADMVLLVRKIDDLQKKLLDLYTDYKTKEQLAKMTEENFKKREEIYLNSQGKSKEELVIADVYYRNAKTSAQRAQDDFLTSRAILENLVGSEALSKIEREE